MGQRILVYSMKYKQQLFYKLLASHEVTEQGRSCWRNKAHAALTWYKIYPLLPANINSLFFTHLRISILDIFQFLIFSFNHTSNYILTKFVVLQGELLEAHWLISSLRHPNSTNIFWKHSDIYYLSYIQYWSLHFKNVVT